MSYQGVGLGVEGLQIELRSAQTLRNTQPPISQSTMFHALRAFQAPPAQDGHVELPGRGRSPQSCVEEGFVVAIPLVRRLGLDLHFFHFCPFYSLIEVSLLIEVSIW